MSNESNQITTPDLVIKVDTSALVATLALLEQIKVAAHEAAASVASIGASAGIADAAILTELRAIRRALTASDGGAALRVQT